jgi:hypothetical protein
MIISARTFSNQHLLEALICVLTDMTLSSDFINNILLFVLSGLESLPPPPLATLLMLFELFTLCKSLGLVGDTAPLLYAGADDIARGLSRELSEPECTKLADAGCTDWVACLSEVVDSDGILLEFEENGRDWLDRLSFGEFELSAPEASFLTGCMSFNIPEIIFFNDSSSKNRESNTKSSRPKIEKNFLSDAIWLS